MIAPCQLRVLLCINFNYDSAAPHVGRSPGDLRRGNSAWAAPCRPEIYQHWDARVLNNFIELLRIDIQGFVNRRQRRLTHSASSRISKMSRGHAVLGSAIFTDANRRHLVTFLVAYKMRPTGSMIHGVLDRADLLWPK
jgi:hypothetical protein